MHRADLPSPRRRAVRRRASAVWTLPSASSTAREWVVRWWSGEGGGLGGLFRLLTLPLEVGFRAVSGLRNRMYDKGALPLQRAPVPVISVGNLSVGGTGKTPLASWLVRGLRARGESPALIVHGYGEDELVLHRRWNPDCLVLAEQDRAYGAWKAARRGATVVVLDDGFQHRRLARDLDVILIPSDTPTKMRLLPRGPFREPLSAVARAHVVALTQKGGGEPAHELEQRLIAFLGAPPMRIALVPDCWTELSGAPSEAPDGDFLAICGIGDPDGFSRTLRQATGRDGELLAFPDHHDYTWGDILEIESRLRGRTLVTTEKDAAKLEAFADDLPGAMVLHLRVEVLEGEEAFWSKVEGVLHSTGGGE
jgi:tetraacyldisaccharide 4'-kinase